MSRPRGSRNRSSMVKFLQSFQGDEPMQARDLLKALRSNELWFKAVKFALDQQDSRALIQILTYLHDHAYGSAPKSVHATLDVIHHNSEDLERARAVAREILEHSTPLAIVDNISSDDVEVIKK